MSFVVGVDIGGTNTDVVIIQGNNVIGWNKTLTTNKISDGVITSIQLAIKNAEDNGYVNVIKNIRRINIGTTQFINAVIKREGLVKVASIRLCGVASHSLPPFCDFPDDLREQIDGGSYLLNGGFEYNNEVITEIDNKEVLDCLKNLAKNGVQHVAVTGIFSPINPSQEEKVKKIVEKDFPSFSITLSSTLGQLGLLERENATILNESLKPLCEKTIAGFKKSLRGIGLLSPVYFTRNDGTLISEQETLQYPVHTFSSGATNSMRGAGFLSSVDNAVIVDIGGTSTDVGLLVDGFPRKASTRVKVGGVNINFRMPDTLSIGLGGGSLVSIQDNDNILVGPASVEYRIDKEALIFGGNTLVASDIAVACGLANFGSKGNVSHLSDELLAGAMENIKSQVEGAVDSIKLSGEASCVILVGGGSILIDPNQRFYGAANVRRPEFYQVANAVGAAISQVSGIVDELREMTEATRKEIIRDAELLAIDRAVKEGAIKESCKIVERSELQMSYITLPYVRLFIKAVGDLDDYRKQGKILLDSNNQYESSSVDTVFGESGTKTKYSSLQKPLNCNSFAIPDKELSSHSPEVNEKGEWIISDWDVDCLAIGCGILGCGGGGSTYLGRLKLLQCFKEGKRPRIIHPSSMKDGAFAYNAACMGVPEVDNERIHDVGMLANALQLSNKLLDMGFTGPASCDQVKDIAEMNGLSCHLSEENGTVTVALTENQPIESGVIFPLEIGGLNGLEPLIIGADLGIPIIDCDGMSRAFPQLQQLTLFIYGSSPYPAVITDLHGNSVCCVKCDSPTALEEFFRKQLERLGCIVAVSMKPFTKEEMLANSCHFTYSQAWYIGNAVKTARELHKCPINSILENARGVLLSQGKISDVERKNKGGFTWGKIIVEGCDAYVNKDISIEFQNEFIIARLMKSDDVLATVPDLITLVDSDTGESIATSELKYGLRITILVLPAMPILTTPRALKFVGPSEFNLKGIEYSRVCDFKEIIPIPKLKKTA